MLFYYDIDGFSFCNLYYYKFQCDFVLPFFFTSATEPGNSYFFFNSIEKKEEKKHQCDVLVRTHRCLKPYQ